MMTFGWAMNMSCYSNAAPSALTPVAISSQEGTQVSSSPSVTAVTAAPIAATEPCGDWIYAVLALAVLGGIGLGATAK